jgi:hypothetical protein
MPAAAYRPHETPTTFAGPTAVQGVGDGDETVAGRIGIVTRRDDDFLTRTEPFAEPRGGAPERASAGSAEGLRQSRAERRASRHNERRAATSKAFVVGAGLMGAALVAAATFTVLVFAGLFTVSSGVGGGHRPVTLVQQPPATTTPPPSPSDATDPTPPSDSSGTFPPSTTAQTGRSPLPSSNRVATPRTTAGAQVRARPPSNSSSPEQLSSASSPPLSDAPAPATPTTSAPATPTTSAPATPTTSAPATPTTSAPDTNPAGYAPPGRNK